MQKRRCIGEMKNSKRKKKERKRTKRALVHSISKYLTGAQSLSLSLSLLSAQRGYYRHSPATALKDVSRRISPITQRRLSKPRVSAALLHVSLSLLLPPSLSIVCARAHSSRNCTRLIARVSSAQLQQHSVGFGRLPAHVAWSLSDWLGCPPGAYVYVCEHSDVAL